MEKWLKGKVTAVSKYGFQCDNEDNWYNYSKHHNVKPVVKDMYIEFSVEKDKYVTNIELDDNVDQEVPKANETPKSFTDKTGETIKRQVAVKCATEVYVKTDDKKKALDWFDTVIALIENNYQEGFKSGEEVDMSKERQ